MKNIEKNEDAKNVSESDDLYSETVEVNQAQGIGFFAQTQQFTSMVAPEMFELTSNTFAPQ